MILQGEANYTDHLINGTIPDAILRILILLLKSFILAVLQLFCESMKTGIVKRIILQVRDKTMGRGWSRNSTRAKGVGWGENITGTEMV